MSIDVVSFSPHSCHEVITYDPGLQTRKLKLMLYCSSGLGLQWLGLRLGFPARDWAGSQQ